MEKEIEIPFGGHAVNLTTTNIATYIQEQDKIPLILAISLYGDPIKELPPYKLIEGTHKIRIAAWFDDTTGSCIIGFRGTSIGQQDQRLDIADDKVSLIYSKN